MLNLTLTEEEYWSLAGSHTLDFTSLDASKKDFDNMFMFLWAKMLTIMQTAHSDQQDVDQLIWNPEVQQLPGLYTAV